MTKARENSDYTGLQGDLAGLQTNITAGDTAARAGRKNLIINGDNRISQRGTYTSALDFVHNSYLLDRWIAGKSGGSIDGTITHSSDTVNGAVCKTQKYIVTTGHAGSWIGGRQILEFPETFIGRTLTVSAWVKSNSDDARILLWDVGSGTNTAIATQAHTGGGAWEYLSSTGTVMAGTTGLTLYMATLSATAAAVTTSTGDYIEFTNVQIELGSVATDFEHRSYGEELALCQRYYEVIADGSVSQVQTFGIGHGYKSDQINWFYQFKVSKRTEAFTLEVVSTSTGYRARSHSTNKFSTTLGMSANLQSINQIEGYMTAISGITEQSCWSLLLNQPSSKIAVSAEL
jgi:hypothetical protein